MKTNEKLTKASELIAKGKELLGSEEVSKETALEAKGYIAKAKELRTEVEKSFDEPVNKVPFDTKGEESMSTKDSNENSVFDNYLRKGLRQMDQKALSSVRLADGGALCPTEFRAELLEALADILKFKGLANVISISSKAVELPVFEHTGTVSNTAELGTMSVEDTSDAFGKKTFTPHKVSARFKVSEELLEDSEVDIARLLIDHFSQRLAEELEDDFINGSGVDEAEGILNATGITATDLGSSATTITGVSGINAVLQAPYDLSEQYRRNGAYIMPRQSVKEVRLLKDSNNVPLFMPMSAGMPAELNGYRVVEMERMPTPAADGDCVFIFGDLKKYTIVERKGITVKRLEETHAATGEIGFILTARVDGAITDSAAFTRYNRN
jgi:HK97 family phage major capsid protein